MEAAVGTEPSVELRCSLLFFTPRGLPIFEAFGVSLERSQEHFSAFEKEQLKFKTKIRGHNEMSQGTLEQTMKIGIRQPFPSVSGSARPDTQEKKAVLHLGPGKAWNAESATGRGEWAVSRHTGLRSEVR